MYKCHTNVKAEAIKTIFLSLMLCSQISHDFGFPSAVQRWVIGKRLAQDRDTLYGHGVHQNGDKAFLFILSAHAAHLTRQQIKLDQDQQRIEGQ